MDIAKYNRKAWDHQVKDGEDGYREWTIPVSQEIIELARAGDWQIVVTPHKL